jgi:tetratricopeptide (TPR) repeat protein
VDISAFSAALAKASPRIKTPIQLTGLIVAGLFFYLASSSSPPNLVAQISAGLIGVTVLLFGIVLNQLSLIKQGSRPVFILALYALFGLLICVFLLVAVYFLLHSPIAETRARANELRDGLLALNASKNAELTAAYKESENIESLIRRTQLNGQNITDDLNARETVSVGKVQRLRLEVDQLSKVIVDLNGPDSTLLKAVELARKLDPTYTPPTPSTFGIAAHAADLKDLEGVLSRDVKEDSWQVIRKRVFLAWVRKVQGQIDGPTVLAEANELRETYPNSPEAIEYAADTYVEFGNFPEAKKMYHRLVDLYKNADPMKQAFATKNLATYTRLADGGVSGEDLMRRAEYIYLNADHKEGYVLANIENDFGGFYLARNDPVGAISRYNQAREYFEQPKSNKFGYAYVLINLGKAHFLIKQFPKALEFLHLATAEQEKTTGLNTDVYAVTLQNAGDVLYATGKFQEAQDCYERELLLLESRGLRPDLVEYVKTSAAKSALKSKG